MNEESKLIELFKKYPGIAARIRRSFAYHYDQIQREIDYYLNFLEEPETLYTFTEKTINLFKSFIHENQTYNPNINCHGSSSHGFPY